MIVVLFRHKSCLFLHLWFDLIKLKEIGIYLAILVHILLHLFSSSSQPLSFLCYLKAKGFCWLSFRGKQTLRHEYLYHVNVNLLLFLSNRILLYSILDVRMKILNMLIMYRCMQWASYTTKNVLNKHYGFSLRHGFWQVILKSLVFQL